MESTNEGGCLKGRKKHQSTKKKEKGGCLEGKKNKLTKEELNAALSAEARLNYLNNL